MRLKSTTTTDSFSCKDCNQFIIESCVASLTWLDCYVCNSVTLWNTINITIIPRARMGSFIYLLQIHSTTLQANNEKI